MKMSETKDLSIWSFFILVLCVRHVFASYHGVVSTTSPQKPLKFYMKLRHREVSRFEVGSDNLVADGVPNESSVAMLVNISFGNPPLPQFLIMDTGSEITWIQCASCTKCYRQSTPLYNPSESGSYQVVGCNSQFCQWPQECNRSSNSCAYKVQYFDQSGSKGLIATEQLTFATTDHGVVTESGVAFGCGMENSVVNPHVIDFASGVLGLNAGVLSLTAQKGRQFSYCIGNLNNRSYAHNQLIIGDGAKFRGYTTPLEVYREFYYLSMEGIMVGNQLLNIDSTVFQRTPSGDGGMIIDSGTTYSQIPRVAYEALKEKVSSLIGSSLNRLYAKDENSNGDYLCYSALKNQTARLPTVKFLFARFAEIEIEPNFLFDQTNWFQICMAVKPANDGYPGIIGLMAQQRYNFGYDIDGKTLYVANVDCETLMD